MTANPKQSNDISTNNSDSFIKRLEGEVESNLQNEQFGVEELAEKVNMSRSNLHRKLQQYTGQSVSQFIREYRLRRALEYLKNDSLSISEVAYQVGFSSPSYFTSCFSDYFGFAPSEAKYNLNMAHEEANLMRPHTPSYRTPKALIIEGTFIIVILLIVYFLFKPDAEYKNGVLPASVSTEKSIAVLPFKNLSTEEENEYFVEGVAGAITTHLARINGLKTISRTSVDKYREGSKSAKEIASELQVTHLLEGSIQRYQNTVRIEVRLIDANSEMQLWAESYDKELKDILNIQSEIAEQVVITLRQRLSSEEKLALNQNITQNTEAYDLYLKGVYQYRTYTSTGNNRAIEYYKQAIGMDSSFALAYVGLANSYIAKASIFSAELKSLEAFRIAKPYLDKALKLAPDLEEAHMWLGFYYLYYHWDFEKSEDEYKKAIVTNDADALAVYADYLNFVKRHDEALAVSKKLDQVHPHYPNSRMVLSLFYLGRHKEAEEFAETRIKSLSNYYTLDSYGFLMLNTGKYEKAISYFQKAMGVEGIRYPRMLGWMGAAYAKSGQEEMAKELIAELKNRKAENDAGSIAFFIAVIYAALGDKATALNWLNTAYENHEMELPWLITEPQFYELHAEPAFRELISNIGFPNEVISPIG